MDEVSLLKIGIDRERSARQHAEKLLEQKSALLYELNSNLEQRVAETLGESQKFGLALSNCDNAVAILTPDLCVTWCNDVSKSIFNAPANEQKAPNLRSALKVATKGWSWENVISNAARDQTSRFEIEIETPGMTELLTLLFTLTPILDTNQNITSLIFVATDATELRRTQKTLYEKEAQYRRIIEAIGMGLIDVSSTFKVKELNSTAASLFMNDVTEKSFFELFRLTGEHRNHQDFFQNSQNSVELQITREYSNFETEHWFIASCVASLGSDEPSYRVTLLDITSRKLMELNLHDAREKAEASNLAKRKFVANISHELRTPINAIVGFMDLLEVAEFSKEQKDFFHAMKIASHSLIELTSDLLDFSKIEANQLKIEKSEFEIRSLVDECVNTFSNQANEKGLSLILNMHDNAVSRCIGDRARIRQILINLISNAVKFTQEGKITISVDSHLVNDTTSKFLFHVSDTGSGIPGELQEIVFNEFEQVSSPFRSSSGGTGLGLAITKQLVELMHGEIRIQSEIDVGTDVFVQIPLQIGDRIEDSRGRSEELKRAEHSYGISLLIAEDDPFNRLYFENAFAQLAVDFRMAQNGNEVIAILEENGDQFDGILMDVRMPELDGLEATRRVRNTLKLNIPIVGLTANTTIDDRVDCIKAGMNYFLPKPCTIKQIEEVVRMLHSKSRSTNKS